MNIFKIARALWNAKGLLKTLKEAFMADEKTGDVKKGVRTSEFWGKVAAQLISLVSGLSGIIDPELAITIVAILEAAYAVSRGIAKLLGKNLPELQR